MTRLWPRLLLALGSGFGLALAFPPQNIALLAWCSLAGLIVALRGARPGQAALVGFLHGVVLATASVPWVYTVMRVHGRLPVMSAVGVLALMVAAFALFPAAFAVAVARIARKSSTLACVAAPFVWTALEFGRTHLPIIGFPWNLLGYAVGGNRALVQLAALGGIYGLSWLVAGYNALLAWVALESGSGRRRAGFAVLLGVTAAVLVVARFGGRLVPGAEPTHRARLVQTNLAQSGYAADWMERYAADLDELERLSTEVRDGLPDLVVWPEVPAPFSFQNHKFAARAEGIARVGGSNFLLGVVEWRPTGTAESGAAANLAPYNSAALLDAEGRRVFLYDKIHLVPFGEYVPLRQWLTFAKKLTAEVGDFLPGSEYKVGVTAAGRGGGSGSGSAGGGPHGGRFSVLICYEAVFPGEVRRFVVNGAELLVNLSNDGWFGRSGAPEQHLAMARVRAVENRRWLLRATNNGHTVAVDPYGRYAARMAPDARGALDAPYAFRSDLTLYARWGDWVAWVSVAAAAACLVLARGPGRT